MTIFSISWGLSFAQNKTNSIWVKTLIDSATNSKSPKERMQLASKAYQIALNPQNKKLIAEATHAVAVAQFRLNNYDAAIDSLQKLLVICNLLADSSGIANTYFTLGNWYIRKSDYANAINFFERVIKFARASNDSTLLANSFNTMGFSTTFLRTTSFQLNSLKRLLKYTKILETLRIR